MPYQKSISLTLGVMATICFAMLLRAQEPAATQQALAGSPELSLRQAVGKLDSQPARLGGGVIDVKETIVIRQSEGGGIIGLPGQTSMIRGGYSGNATVLRWVGKPGGTIIRIEDSINVTLSGLIIDGNATAGIAVHVAKGERWGSAHVRLQDLTIKNSKVGVQFGSERADSACSDSIFDNVTLNNCRTGILLLNDQSVNHLFRGGGFVNCGVGFDAARGGNVLMQGTSAGATDVFLRVAGGGMNASKFVVQSPRFEASGDSQRHMTLVNARPTGECHVVIEHGQEGGANRVGPRDNSTDPRFIIGPRAIVDVRGHRHLGATPVASVAIGGLYRDRNSIFLGEPSDARNWIAGRGRIDVAGATDVQGFPWQSYQRGFQR